MNHARTLLVGLLTAGFLASAVPAADEMVKAKDGSGHFGYKHTPILSWCGYHVHDPDRPAPKRITVAPAPDRPTPPPSDAVILFDGKDLSQWQPSDARVADGNIVSGNGNLASKQSFGDCQVHLEWMAPANFEGPWYNQGNNGVFIMGLYEIQIFDSYNHKIYPDGMAGAIYGQTPPMTDASLPPGQWQSYDLFFTAPVFKDGKLAAPARLTMLHNGVLIHLNETIHGETGHQVLPAYRKQVSEGPLTFGGHGCPVRFRNVWVRPLPKAPAPAK